MRRAATGNDETLMNEVIRFIEILMENKVELIYGGGKRGIMGIVAETVIRCQGKITGIMPQSLIDKEIAHDALSELIAVNSLGHRKQLICEKVDSFVLLPGGVGSLDEFFDALSQAQIGIFQKKFGILNVNHYYDPMLSQLNKAVETSFMKKEVYNMICAETTAEALFNAMTTQPVCSMNRYAKEEALQS